ncbi:MAG: hypothetical protein M3342_12195 [Bacteroidota bacterium]|nr:hypothetical protein [Flavisolibacter sp.]MBD0367882.1 hypothetical protein [Flavisolibacter sp.]MDQ3844760.1 hypothetical protein [Bacteroidota bacterium]
MGKAINIFKSFEEQELFFLTYFFHLTPSERLRALAKLQEKNQPANHLPVKEIRLRKHFIYGH